MSYLLGILHIKENIENKKEFADSDMIPTEAIEWMMSRASVSKDDFYNNIDPKARYRAFTVSKLTSLDAIERTKELLNKTLEEGETMKEWYDRLKSDEILSKIGFHENNPFYLETVFRTNTISAYNAGRWEEIQKYKDDIALLEYVAIDDSRTTEICAALDGVRLPVDDPFWKNHYPPNHFNCRSQVREIYIEEAKALGYKATDKDKISKINEVEIPKDFDTSIVDSWWNETESMKKRAEKYGIDKEFNDKKKQLNLKNSNKRDNVKIMGGYRYFETRDEVESWVNDNFIDWRNNLTKNELKSLRQYKGVFSEDFNSLLRKYKGQKINNDIKNIENSILKYKTKEDIIVYRAFFDENIYKNILNSRKNDVIFYVDNAFVSTSLLKEGRQVHSDNYLSLFGKVIEAEYRVKKGFNLAFLENLEKDKIDKYILNGKEFELLLNRRIFYNVIDFYIDGNVLRIICEIENE